MQKRHSMRLLACLVLMTMVLLVALSGCRQSQPENTAAPTEAPTEEPAAEATEEPAAEPTAEATAEPTAEPTTAPTEEPAAAATRQIKIAVTKAPTAEAAAEPTAAATQQGKVAATKAPAAAAENTEAPAAETAAESTEAPAAETAAENTEAPAAETAAESTEAPVAAAADDSAVVASFDGQTLTKGEVQDQVKSIIDQQVMYYAMYGQTIDPTDEDFQRSMAQAILEDLVKQQVLANRAEAMGLWTGSEEDIAEVRANAEKEFEATLDEYAPTFQTQMGGEESGVTLDMARDQVRTELMAQGYTEEWLYEEMLREAVTDRLRAEATKDVAITEEEAKASYDAMVATAKTSYAEDLDLYVEDLLTDSELPYTPGGMRLIQHIMLQISSEEEDARAEVIEQAGTILAEIKDGTKTFAEAMAEYNQDTGMDAAPFDVGYPVHAGTQLFEAAFVDAAMALENVGDISDVVEGTYSVHILQYASDLEEKEVPFEERAEEYTATLLTAAQDTAYQTAEAAWLEEAAISYDVEPLVEKEDLPEAAVPETKMKSAIAAETQVFDAPNGTPLYTLAADAVVAEQGSITVEDETWSFVELPGETLLYGYVKTTDLKDAAEGTTGDASQVTKLDVDWEVAPDPIFTIVMNDSSLLYGVLYPDVAPLTVGSFISLANQGFYNGTIFHRVIEGFVIQGGDPEGTGAGGPGYAIKGEFSINGVENGIIHERGVLSMARGEDNNSAGSQFFVVLDSAPHLDGSYAGFGRVLEGMDSTDTILAVPRDTNDRPKVDQTVKLIYVETHGEDYPMEAYDAAAAEATVAPDATPAPVSSDPAGTEATDAPEATPAPEATDAPAATDAPTGN